MMLRTEWTPSPAQPQLGYADRLLALGSCFAGRMGQRLHDARFRIDVNPLGIAYSPLVLSRQLLATLGAQPWAEPCYDRRQGLWHSFDLHSSFGHSDRDQFDAQVARATATTRAALQEASVLLLTFGTAWTFFRQDSGEPVANCHRYPAAFFTRALGSVTQLTDACLAAFEALWHLRPGAQILLTVSPVRHTRATLEGNALSKATLRLACQQLQEASPQVYYFPAYELMIDDLRDYRFYADDLIHPSTLAETYIWEKFVQAHVSPADRRLLHDWEEVQRDLAHRPRQPGSAAHRRFLEQVLRKLQALAPHLDCTRELEQVQTALTGDPATDD
ncbi:MAG: GSCFA domain-containing protein [Bacteroidia bacterium]